MYKSSSSRVLPIVLVLIVIAIAIAALVSVGRALFSGGDSATETQQYIGRDVLLNTAVQRSVRMTVRGPIIADEDFRSYQFTIDSSSRRLNVYSGYLDQTIDSMQLGNNTQAYEEFVYALAKANLMKGTVFTDEDDDTRGICASGRLYEFEVLDSTTVVKRLWTSTCKGSKGSLKASTAQVRNLFLEQIPDAKKPLSKIDL